MKEDKEIARIIDETIAFIRDVPVSDRALENHRTRLVEDYKNVLIPFLVARDIIGERPWCWGIVKKYPPPIKISENK